ncbi:ethionine resistance protein, variant 2 [Entomophthora muscae]|uniref:Ethionine resistance protein, variant 2 n=1 Tax=Entomophthora muscae TaxID=34485 RepID=A0ACC2S356_9FUNG|nr:ethionine resistance protein, variant 2 [Entomophthora muscae]
MSEATPLLSDLNPRCSELSYSLPIETSEYFSSLPVPESTHFCLCNDISSQDFTNPLIYLNHCWKIFCSTVAVSLGYIIEFLNPFISTYAIARLGSKELASSALSSMFANVTGWSVVFGMTTSLDTLCSQAYTGSQDVTSLGVYIQRGFLATVSLFLPVSAIWWNTEFFLLAIKQDPELAQLCGLYLRWYLISIPASIILECCKKFLQAQGIMKASTQILVLSVPVCFILNFFLVQYPPTSLGFIGAPIAAGLTDWFCAFMSIGYIILVDGKRAWGGFSMKAFSDWGPLYKLGLPGVIQVCSEWWAYVLMALGASYISIEALAAHSVVTNIGGMFYEVALGGGVVASSRIGNALGDSRPNLARLSALCSLIVVLFIGILSSIVVMIFTPFWSTFLNDEPEIVLIVLSLLPILAFFQVSVKLQTISHQKRWGMLFLGLATESSGE